MQCDQGFSIQMNRYERLRPDEAFREATTILSRTNPRQMWSLCAFLSVTETYGQTPDDFFFPHLNYEKVRVLCEVALDSKALDYKNEELSTDQVIDALNYGNRAMTDYEGMRLMDGLRELAGPDLAFRVYLSRLGNIQGRYQDPRFHERVGRLIGMLEELPRSHRDKMPDEFWTMADPVLGTIRSFLEFPILSLAGGIWALLELYGRPFREFLARFDRGGARSAGPLRCFKVLLEHRREWQPRFVLPVERTVERTTLTRFLELFARTTKELHELRQNDHTYRHGGIARRLSPLERYPVVWVSDAEVVIPNVRYLYRNFADIVHFSLWEEKIPSYNEVRGGLQELYLHVLIEKRLPGVAIIPERPYQRGKQRVKSADLTLIEGDRLILIESKAQRMRAETRLNTLPDNLLDNLGGAVEAIVKSEAKIADLYAGIPAFEDVQAVIDSTRSRPPITVAVVGEEITMMGEVIHELERSYPGYPLAEMKLPHCILGIDAFERAVEVAATTGRKLGDLLEEYISEVAANRPDTPSIDEFGGGTDLENTFAVSFFRE